MERSPESGSWLLAPAQGPSWERVLPQTLLHPKSGTSVPRESLTAPHNLFFLLLHLQTTLGERNGSIQNSRQFSTDSIYFEGIPNFFFFFNGAQTSNNVFRVCIRKPAPDSRGEGLLTPRCPEQRQSDFCQAQHFLEGLHSFMLHSSTNLGFYFLIAALF